MANKTIEYAIYPNSAQNEQCQKTFGCCRFVYNQMIGVHKDRYEKGEKFMSKISANNYCNEILKNRYPFLREVDKFALSNAIFNLDSAYRRFFNHLSNFPKYKDKHNSKKSYRTCLTGKNIVIGDNYIKLPKLGKVKAVIHRKPNIDWKIKSATVCQNKDGTYYVAILFEYEQGVTNVTVTEDTTLGLDYKSDGLYVDSNGHCCEMPHYFRKSSDKLAKRQYELSKKVFGSKNYNKQKTKIAKIHRHIANQRKDFLHKESIAIAKQYSCVCVENLNMKALSNKGFGNGKATLDNGYGMFLNMLEYKLKEHGGYLVKVEKFYPSSQICHWCGQRNLSLRNLRIREWDCPNCGKTKIDRDWNAALNIKYKGLERFKIA